MLRRMKTGLTNWTLPHSWYILQFIGHSLIGEIALSGHEPTFGFWREDVWHQLRFYQRYVISFDKKLCYQAQNQKVWLLENKNRNRNHASISYMSLRYLDNANANQLWLLEPRLWKWMIFIPSKRKVLTNFYRGEQCQDTRSQALWSRERKISMATLTKIFTANRTAMARLLYLLINIKHDSHQSIDKHRLLRFLSTPWRSSIPPRQNRSPILRLSSYLKVEGECNIKAKVPQGMLPSIKQTTIETRAAFTIATNQTAKNILILLGILEWDCTRSGIHDQSEATDTSTPFSMTNL